MKEEVGKVSHYYDKVGVAVVDLKKSLKVGETVTFQYGEKTFSQEVQSIQIEHEQVEHADGDTSVGIKVEEEAKPGTIVLRGEA